jgi:hypothetical protein
MSSFEDLQDWMRMVVLSLAIGGISCGFVSLLVYVIVVAPLSSSSPLINQFVLALCCFGIELCLYVLICLYKKIHIWVLWRWVILCIHLGCFWLIATQVYLWIGVGCCTYVGTWVFVYLRARIHFWEKRIVERDSFV